PALDFQGLDHYFEYARETGAILVPHHIGYKVGARGMNWNLFDESLMPLVEIFSMHGCSERDGGPFAMDLGWMGPRESGGCAVEGLRRGKRFGFIASSDGHNAYPGAYPIGLVAAFADDLTRDAIWDALCSRRTYAVTGDRIELDVSLNGALMGSVVEPAAQRHIHIRVKALDAIEQIDVVKNGSVVGRHTGSETPVNESRMDRFVVRIGWGWGGGMPEPLRWEGLLRVNDGEIASVAPCFGPPAPDEIMRQDEREVEWRSTTAGYNPAWQTNRYRVGGDCSLVVEVKGDRATRLDIAINGKMLAYDAGDLLHNSHVELMGGPFGAKVKVYRAVPAQQYDIELAFEDVDTPGKADADWYYVRVRQSNGQMAWSSPIWVEAE
ncbi:MAG: DUF3604 domain-containing protein, partial [Armatimonadota bacterium]